MVVQMPDISWYFLWLHVTHAQIMWVWLKTGAIGFATFWIFMGSGLSRATYLARRLRDSELRVFSILCMLGIVTAMGFSYVDMALVGPRVTAFLGTLLGCLSVLSRLGAPRQDSAVSSPAVAL
jgi:hypothetical protein